MPRHYLDTASTERLRPLSRLAMAQALEVPSADPGRLHQEGLTVRHQLELARQSVAGFFGAKPREVMFTSSATEAIAAAVWGAADADPDGSIIVSAAEHSAVRLAAERTGRALTVPIDGEGLVDPGDVAAAIDGEHRAGRGVALVACQLGNHEVGAIQPVDEVASICRARDARLLVDGAQAAGRLPITFPDLGVDFLAVSGHKMGGPAGSGALLIRRGVRISPLLVGGDQERARRAGLENTISAVGFGAACAELADTMPTEVVRCRQAATTIRHALTNIDGVTLFGPADPSRRLPHLVCAGIRDIEPQAVLLLLDQAGIAAHSGSSCASESLEPSPVLEAMGVEAHRSLRVSVGWHTTDDDIEAVCRALPAAVSQLRSLR